MNQGIPSHITPRIKARRKRSLAGLIFRVITLTTAFLTLVSGWSGLVNPANWWFIAITGLGFPFCFTLNFIFLVIWLFKSRKMALVTFVVLILTLNRLPLLVQWNSSNYKPDYTEGSSDEVEVMSFNVRLFDLYNWSHSNETRSRIFDFLNARRPGILCLQEFYSSERNNQDNADDIRDLLHYKASHIEYPINLYGTDHWGIATYSSYPIVRKGVLYFDKKTANICIYSDIKLGADTIRVFNCHLQSVRFGEKEYKFLENIGNGEQTGPIDETATQSTRNILARLKHAFIKRASQAELIAENIRSSPYPVVVCGDFNDTPNSYAYRTISEGLLDAFRVSGSGLGTTYAGPIPGLRIDYILHSSEIASYQFSSSRLRLSDHFPIGAKFIVKK